MRDRHTVRQTERENGERERGYMERRETKREEMEGWKMGNRERLSVSSLKHTNQLIAIMYPVIPLSTAGLSMAEGISHHLIN